MNYVKLLDPAHQLLLQCIIEFVRHNCLQICICLFHKRINNLEKNFYLTLEGYKNAYIQKEDATSENINLFDGAERRLNNVFSSLIQLQADIQATISNNKDVMSKGNAQITTAKQSWENSKQELQNEYATNLAAKPSKAGYL